MLTQRGCYMRYFCGRGWRRRVTPLKEALTALADVLAKRPARKSYSTEP